MLNDTQAVFSFLFVSSVGFFVVFFEVGYVFGVGEVFFAAVYRVGGDLVIS